MPIQLTTPLNMGALDSPYQHVRIVEFDVNIASQTITLVVQYGNLVSSAWTNGLAIEGKTVQRFTITGSDYTTLTSSVSAAAGELYYDKIAALLYQWLITKGYYAGTIV